MTFWKNKKIVTITAILLALLVVSFFLKSGPTGDYVFFQYDCFDGSSSESIVKHQMCKECREGPGTYRDNRFRKCFTEWSCPAGTDCICLGGPSCKYENDHATGCAYIKACKTGSDCGACQDCDTSTGTCTNRCSASECTITSSASGNEIEGIKGTCSSSGKCPGE